MLTRLARWWLNRTARREPPPSQYRPRVGECICGRQLAGEDLHVVVAAADDDQALGIEGQTAMSADFCSSHCPGGCLRGCAKIEV
jgi:hypothetical protein